MIQLLGAIARCPLATLNGGAQCEDMAFVGSHATVAPSVIMENSTLSANSLATKTVLANSIFRRSCKSLKLRFKDRPYVTCDEKTLIIAEAGVNHNGDIEIAKKLY